MVECENPNAHRSFVRLSCALIVLAILQVDQKTSGGGGNALLLSGAHVRLGSGLVSVCVCVCV